ncbi:MAG: transporter related [Acidimicrobiaceae bacterium]|nr:transporter related [Acidimicrobiaceae bacterium]
MSTDRGPLLEVSHVTKRFPRPEGPGLLTVLEDINLSLAPGEFVSLIGPSGCGKTTLIRLMSGLMGCDDGWIALRNERFESVPKGVGFVFQEPALLPWCTVSENIAFALTASADAGKRRPGVDDLVNKQLELTSLTPFASYYPTQISGGMQQRVGLARALVGSPDVLFMDEPLSALDAFTRTALQADLGRIIEAAATTTVLVTHDIDEAIFMSDRVVVMKANPGEIAQIVDVPLARPRSHEALLDDADYVALRTELMRILLKVSPHIFNNSGN